MISDKKLRAKPARGKRNAVTANKGGAAFAGARKAIPPSKGRPSGYSPELGKVICARMLERSGEEKKLRALRDICTDSDMPSESMVYRWLDKYPEFRENYARAREAVTDMMSEDILHIADTEPDPQKARVRIDARKWWASKVAPKKYGDKLEVDTPAEGGLATAVAVSAASVAALIAKGRNK